MDSRCGDSTVRAVAQDGLVAVVTRHGPPHTPHAGKTWSACHLSTSSDSAHRGLSHLGTEEWLAELEEWH